MMIRTVLLRIVLYICLLLGPVFGQAITTKSLIKEMLDLQRLAEFPKPAYKTIQFSSYDRQSILPEGPNWFANQDGFGGEPVPNFESVVGEPNEKGIGEYLICDVKGPGAIVRTWTAGIDGKIKMFLDDTDKPLYEGSADTFFRAPFLPFKPAGFNGSILKDAFQQADAAYFPIPFSRRCRIIWVGDTNKGHFYHIQIRMYEKNAEVKTFTPQDINDCNAEIKEVARIFSNPKGQWQYKSNLQPIKIYSLVESGKIREIASLKGGPKAIERFTLKIYAGGVDWALRQTVLNIVFDDYPWGQVQAPIGDFFGAAPGINPYDSIPFTVEPNGVMTCRFIMPFAKSCKIFLDNKSRQEVAVEGSILPMPYEWNEGSTMYFRARWRVNHNLVSGSDDKAQDMPYLIANGKGTYVGSAVMLMNTTLIPSGFGGWWGEGDEKVFIDDDVRPSIFGTGSEDYFNYSWGSPDIFQTAYSGQPRADGPQNRGFISNYRWHILDCMPFKNRIAFYMELMTHEHNCGISYARIGYLYGFPGLKDDHLIITKKDVNSGFELPANWQPAARKGAAGFTFYQAEDIIEKDQKISFEEHNMWAGSKLMIFHPHKKGNEAKFKLNIREKGQYKVIMTIMKSDVSGKFSAKVDETVLCDNDGKNIFDLYVPYRKLSRNLEFRPVEMDAGEHNLIIKSETDNKVIGIDFIWVGKAK